MRRFKKKKLQSVGNERLNGLLLSFISPLISCLHSSPSCQRSLFRFYARQCSLKVSRTPEKIADDRCAGGTCLRLQSRYLSPEVIRGLMDCFSLNGGESKIFAQLSGEHVTVFSGSFARGFMFIYLFRMLDHDCPQFHSVACTHVSFKRSETELPHFFVCWHIFLNCTHNTVWMQQQAVTWGTIL